MGPKIKTGLLMGVMVAMVLVHFLPGVVEERMLRRSVERMKRRFNRMLSEEGEDERLRMLKVLINNARHCRDVPLDGCVADVRRAYEQLEIRSSRVFLRLSGVYNLSIFSPVFLPVVIQSLGILRHGWKGASWRGVWGAKAE